MMIYEYANENHLVTEFIQYSQTNKLVWASGKTTSLFVWANELWLPEGGKNGYSGSIDLIATDEDGNVWLIEAKQSNNPELSANIWERQILNYRRGLGRRSQEEISLKARRFLLNRGGNPSNYPFITTECDSLLEAFCRWAQFQGKEKEAGHRLYNQTMKHIHEETVICAVMADTFRKDVWEGRPFDDKPYGYIVVEGTGSEFAATAVVSSDQIKRPHVRSMSTYQTVIVL